MRVFCMATPHSHTNRIDGRPNKSHFAIRQGDIPLPNWRCGYPYGQSEHGTSRPIMMSHGFDHPRINIATMRAKEEPRHPARDSVRQVNG
jgi:hypothetical protein